MIECKHGVWDSFCPFCTIDTMRERVNELEPYRAISIALQREIADKREEVALLNARVGELETQLHTLKVAQGD